EAVKAKGIRSAAKIQREPPPPPELPPAAAPGSSGARGSWPSRGARSLVFFDAPGPCERELLLSVELDQTLSWCSSVKRVLPLLTQPRRQTCRARVRAALATLCSITWTCDCVLGVP